MTPKLRFLLLALAGAILFLGVLHRGDLAGYDDAMWAVEAKGIAHTGDWLTPRSRGGPALEHPPLFVWGIAVFLKLFGISDWAARLPAALSALGILLLVYWLARRLLEDSLSAATAMAVMLATPYFIKYAGHAMSDVPTAFLFTCAVCAWVRSEDDPRWVLAAGAFTGAALMTRGLVGVALIVAFGAHAIWLHRRPAWAHLLAGLALAVLPFLCWELYLLARWSGDFVNLHNGWLERQVYGALDPPWRRYTGAFEYAWMLTKSYWPWLPALAAGIVITIRARRRNLYVLVCWAGAVFLLCAATRARVLRYMLPAYPAFSILAAAAIARFTPRRWLERILNWFPAAAVAAALVIAVAVPDRPHALEMRDLAQRLRSVAEPGALVGFYDGGVPRYDETNQLEWYGNCVPLILTTPQELAQAVARRQAGTFVLDRPTYLAKAQSLPHQALFETARLVCFRLK